MRILTVKNDNEELRRPSLPVNEDRFGTEELRQLATNLIEAMMNDDGVGIAAPQVGIKDRIIIVNVSALGGARAYVNPVITSRSLTTSDGEEGCLSVPGVYGMVERHKKITVEAYSIEGQKMTLDLKGFPAVVFQHEIDHLNGVLFIDKIKKLTHGEMPNIV